MNFPSSFPQTHCLRISQLKSVPEDTFIGSLPNVLCLYPLPPSSAWFPLFVASSHCPSPLPNRAFTRELRCGLCGERGARHPHSALGIPLCLTVIHFCRSSDSFNLSCCFPDAEVRSVQLGPWQGFWSSFHYTSEPPMS